VNPFYIFNGSTSLTADFGFHIGSSKRNRVSCLTLAGMLLVLSSSISAQEQAKIPKLGWLGARSGITAASGREIFRREFRELGYVEGKNIVLESRYAPDNKFDRLPALADELVRLKVDVLLAAATLEALAAKNATKTIPIVFFGAGDPVSAGLVDSLARPGGNLTGFTSIGPVLAGKRLELLKETIPKLARVAVLWNAEDPASTHEWKESQLSARELGLEIHSMEVSSTDKLENAFAAASKAGSAALAGTSSPLFASNQGKIAELATKHRLPTIFNTNPYVEVGGLMSYGQDRAEPYRRGALMVDKILKGAKPADLPVEQPTKFELAINLKTAKQIGLTIPPNVLARADKVIR
jgi:putative tryptophan/tyrosine transport system substrate-binding protein